MNQTIFFSFVIINNIIIFIYGCITFENDNDGNCSQTESKLIDGHYNLKCIIHNPLAKINSTTCKEKNFDTITVFMTNLEDLENFCLNNNETVMKFLSLFKRIRGSMTTFIIELENLLSSSDRVELTINKQWIIKLFGHHKKFYSTLQLNMRANDWNKINLTIHPDVNRTVELEFFELYLKQPGVDITCIVYLSPPRFYSSSYMDQHCRNFITYIDHDDNAVPWPPTKSTSSTTTIWLWEVAETTFEPITFTIPTAQTTKTSRGLWAYILSPTLIIIIILAIIIYCIMKKNRKKTIPQTYSQSVTTNPVYTNNVPMYYNPPFSQK